MDDAIEEAQENGVTVYRDIDKSKFIEAVQPMHEAFESKGDAYKSLYEDIQKYAVAEAVSYTHLEQCTGTRILPDSTYQT